MNMLIILLNLVFHDGPDAYPTKWLSFVNAIPKKGRLLPPKFVRFISVMGVFEKIYQTILNNRLYSFLKIPSQQSAYQKGKGCNLHVMTIRLLKILTTKTRQKLYITFTDFEAAFDLVSRRLLFEKLVKLGVSSIVLGALIAIYTSSKSVIEYNNEYSDYLVLLAGVKQGAPPSGLLYIAYTVGLIDIYNNSFNPEPLINVYHLLVHADDILILATNRLIAIEKLKCLIGYYKENYIKLQMSKCAVMCVNSKENEDLQPIELQNLTLNQTVSEIYLGSAITNSSKIVDDVNADIKLRQKSVVKYFAFLRSNSNAPVHVKLKVLDACILSSILYNAETWCDAKFERLEVVYRKMLKSILGVSTTTCTEFIYIELGIMSLKTRVMIKQWMFWKKILEIDNSNPLAHVINVARQYNLKEIKHYDNLIETYSCIEEIVSKFYEDIKASIRSKAENGRSKYVTYIEINPSLETPSIYNTIINKKSISMIAKLRTSSHNLRIEMGRRTGLIREQRICHCGQEVEYENHFLLQCVTYDEIRRKHQINVPSIDKLLTNERYVKYIYELFESRKQSTLK